MGMVLAVAQNSHACPIQPQLFLGHFLFCHVFFFFGQKHPRLIYPMAGLGIFYQKGTLAVTMPIATAFKFCIGHRKNGLLNH